MVGSGEVLLGTFESVVMDRFSSLYHPPMPVQIVRSTRAPPAPDIEHQLSFEDPNHSTRYGPLENTETRSMPSSKNFMVLCILYTSVFVPNPSFEVAVTRPPAAPVISRAGG